MLMRSRKATTYKRKSRGMMRLRILRIVLVEISLAAAVFSAAFWPAGDSGACWVGGFISLGSALVLQRMGAGYETQDEGRREDLEARGDIKTGRGRSSSVVQP